MLRVASVVHSQVRGDAVEPGAEARFGAVGLARAVDPQKDFLRQLFRDRLIPDHSEHEMNDRLAVLLDQVAISGVVAVAHPEHKLGVVKLSGLLRQYGRTPGRDEALSWFQRHSRHTPTNPRCGRWLRTISALVGR